MQLFIIFAIMPIESIVLLVFSILSALLIVVYHFVFGKLLRHQPKMVREKALKKISVVICAKNEAKNLQAYLPKVLEQNYPNFEVIVVDDHSTDETWSVLQNFSKTYRHLKPIQFLAEKKSGGKKEALAFGIHQAENEWLVLTDADCVPRSKNWLLGTASGFQSGADLVLGIGRYEQESGFLNHWIQLDTWMIAMQYLSFALLKKPYMSVGRNVGYTKKLFQSVGGFERHLSVASGDDDLFVQEIGNQTAVEIVYLGGAQTTSAPKKSFKSWWRQKVRHVSAGVHYKKSSLFLLGSYQAVVVAWYVLLLVGMCFTPFLYWILTIAVVKKLVMFNVFKRILRKLDVTENLPLLMVFDVLSIIVNNTAGIISITSKKGTW